MVMKVHTNKERLRFGYRKDAKICDEMKNRKHTDREGEVRQRE